MFPAKKRVDHAEEYYDDDEESEIDFAWIVFVGMEIGYREREIRHMYYGKWADLYMEYKKMHNIRMKKMIFAEKKQMSLLDM